VGPGPGNHDERINPLPFMVSTEEPASDHYRGETFCRLFALRDRTRLYMFGQFEMLSG
jgi:hypothetical protein